MSCPICSTNIAPLGEMAQTAHINNCLDNPVDVKPDVKPDNKVDININKSVEIVKLTDIQTKALDYCNKKAKILSKGVVFDLYKKLVDLDYKREDLDTVTKYIENDINVVIHINPANLLGYLIKDEYYRNLFEIKTGGGCTDLGIRSGWEHDRFRGIYDNAPAVERVKYGTLNITNNPIGVAMCVGYGDGYLVLNKSVHDRISFFLNDNTKKEPQLATFKYPHIILNIIDVKLLDELLYLAINKKNKYNVSNYKYHIEALIHGDVNMYRDIKSINMPVKYKTDKHISGLLSQFCTKYKIPLIYF